MPKLIIAAAAALLMTATAAAAQTPGPRSGERADIPFATNNGIRTFTPARDSEGVYIQDRSRNWYYASFYTRCQDLNFSLGIGFKTFGNSSTLSRGDTIYAGREACRIADLVRSGPPPEKVKKPKKKKA
jgi:hypothetical protein